LRVDGPLPQVLHSPEGDFGDYLTEILGSDEVLDQVGGGAIES